MAVSRRNLLLAGVGAVVVVGAAAIAMRYSDEKSPIPGETPAPPPGDSGNAELMQAGPLGEKAMGDPNAPITVIEYASMTCTHCAHFAEETFPEFKEKYIDTGKAYYILREFPLDPVATAAFMLARCVPESQYFTFVDALFKNQKLWAFTDDRIGGLGKMGRQAGLSQEKIEQCLTNQELLDGVNWVKERGANTFDVNSTPTFFINGEILRGALPFDEFEKKLTEHLSS